MRSGSVCAVWEELASVYEGTVQPGALYGSHVPGLEVVIHDRKGTQVEAIICDRCGVIYVEN